MKPLADTYRPRKMGEFVGLPGPRAVIEKLIADPWESAWYFVGDPGTGKTSMALALCEAIGGELHHIPSRKCDLKMVGHLWNVCHYTPMNGGFHLVVVDEADQMTQPAQLAFLTDLEKLPPRTIYVFTANGTTGMHERFMSRCRVLQFNTKGADDAAAAHLAKIWTEQAGPATRPDFREVYVASGRNLRTALMNLEMLLIDPDYEVAEVRSASPQANLTRRPFVIPSTEARQAAARKAWETRRKKSRKK